MVVVTPTSPSHSRATLGIAQGPNPVWDFFYPRGYPQLSPALCERADEGNHICDAAVGAMQAAAEAGCLAVLDFPEDLGATRRGIPAPIWQRDELKDLAAAGYVRGAIYLKVWGVQGILNPTGLLSNAKSLQNDTEFHVGWPSFDDQHNYLGPLPPRSQEDLSREPPAQASFSRLCMKLTGHVFQSWVDSACSRIIVHTPEVGAGGLESEGTGIDTRGLSPSAFAGSSGIFSLRPAERRTN